MPNFKVVFVRHGESEWNKQNLFCGWNDVNLSETGMQKYSWISSGLKLILHFLSRRKMGCY